MIKPKTRITSFSQTGVLPSGYQLLLHRPPANEKRQRENENGYETTWMTPIKFKITRVPMTAATSGRKLIIVLYILFIVVLCSLLIVTVPSRTCMYIGYGGRSVKPFLSNPSFLHAVIRMLLWPVLVSKQYRPTRNGN